MWQPNKRQWIVIVAAVGLAGFIWIGAAGMSRSQAREHQRLAIVIVIAGTLGVWFLEEKRK